MRFTIFNEKEKNRNFKQIFQFDFIIIMHHTKVSVKYKGWSSVRLV